LWWASRRVFSPFDNDDRDAIAEKIARAAAVHDENN
jgi:hypothetical protein